MDLLYTHGAGLDVHKQSVVAHARITDANGRVTRHTHTFGTMTADLLNLATWLLSLEITHVAMESTGEYWKPICAPRSASVECFHSETSQGVCEWLAGQAGRTEATPCLKHPRQCGGQILDDLSRC